MHHVAGEGRTGEVERAGLADASSCIEISSNFPGPQRAMKRASGVPADGAGHVSGSAPPCQRVPHGAARQIAADRSWAMRRFHECQGGGRSRNCSSRHSLPEATSQRMHCASHIICRVVANRWLVLLVHRPGLVEAFGRRRPEEQPEQKGQQQDREGNHGPPHYVAAGPRRGKPGFC